MRPVPTPVLELLLLCARTQIDEDCARRISTLLHHSLDWDGLLHAAWRHGLLPLLYRSLSGLASSNVPAHVLGRLQSLFDGNRFRNLVFIQELLGVLQALETTGVTAIPYKGPALAAYLYQDLNLRQFSDIDLLVRPSDAVKARRVLLERGYIPYRHLSNHAEMLYAQLHGAFAFTSTGQITVDLSWRIAPTYWRLPTIPEAAWNRLGRVTVAGVDVPWFAPEDLLLVLCLHGCKHKWETMKWIVDIAELLRTHPDLNWRKVGDESRRAGAEQMLALGVFLANDLLDAHLSAEMLQVVRSNPAMADLAQDVCQNLFAVDPKPVGTLAMLPFLAKVADRLDTKVCCQALRPIYFLLHRVVRPCVHVLRGATAG